MKQHTLDVPAEYAAQFRRAILEEIKLDSDGVKASLREGPGEILGWTQRVNYTVAVLNQIPAVLDEDVEVTSDAETLAHVCEEMARGIAGPELQRALLIGPQDTVAARDSLALLDAARWAVSTAREMHTELARERGFEAVA